MNPKAYTIAGAVMVTGLPRSTIYELLGKGALVGRKAGRRTLITNESIDAYLASLPPAEIRPPAAKAGGPAIETSSS